VGRCTVDGTNKMFTRQSGRYARKLKRRGLDGAQKLLLSALEKQSLPGRSIIEIGCGAGGLLVTLLERGARSGTGVDISEGMIARAREWAAMRSLGDRTTFVRGDFVAVAEGLQRADVVVLDKVICCYADFAGLIHSSAARADRLYAVSFPGDRWASRIYFKAFEKLARFLRWSFHPYYHSPATIESLIRDEGFNEVDAAETYLWQIKIYRRTKSDAV
jgi:SAM-dependent methyltransferase